MKWKVALDYSGNEIAIAVLKADDLSVAAETFTEVPGRDSSRLPIIYQEAMDRAGARTEDVIEWTLGMGPGSFTALRVASAFVIGLAFSHLAPESARMLRVPGITPDDAPESATGDMNIRGVPSACGMASSGKRVLVLYDGRKQELLAYGLKLQDGFYVPDGYQGVLANHDEFAAIRGNYDTFVAGTLNIPAVKAFAPDLDVEEVQHVSAAALAKLPAGPWLLSPADPIYLRPAVFVDPKPIRQFNI